MDEKVLREIKIVETEDGFRIEMKGDKEELRKMIFDQSRPFFVWGEHEHESGHDPFGGRPPFEHLREHLHEHHQRHGHHRDHEHRRPPFNFFFERRVEEGDPRVEALRSARRNWKFKRGGYDLGPWWDEGAQDEPDIKL